MRIWICRALIQFYKHQITCKARAIVTYYEAHRKNYLVRKWRKYNRLSRTYHAHNTTFTITQYRTCEKASRVAKLRTVRAYFITTVKSTA